jgi:hypothetical protein
MSATVRPSYEEILSKLGCEAWTGACSWAESGDNPAAGRAEAGKAMAAMIVAMVTLVSRVPLKRKKTPQLGCGGLNDSMSR